MFKILSFTFVSFLLLSSPHYAQQYSENNSENIANLSQELENYTTRAKRHVSENTNGSPFLNESFIMGSLLNQDNILVTGVALRYNAFHDEFQVKKSMGESDENVEAIRKTSEIYIQMGDAMYAYLLSVNGTSGYFNILFEGKNINLYKKNSKKFVEGAKSVNMMTGNHPNRLVDETAYFIVVDNGELLELTGSRNAKVQAIARNNRNEVRKYVKDNGINVNREDDLIKLVKFVNKNF